MIKTKKRNRSMLELGNLRFQACKTIRAHKYQSGKTIISNPNIPTTRSAPSSVQMMRKSFSNKKSKSRNSTRMFRLSKVQMRIQINMQGHKISLFSKNMPIEENIPGCSERWRAESARVFIERKENCLVSKPKMTKALKT